MKRTQSAMDFFLQNNHNVLKEAGCRRRPFTAEALPIGKKNPFSKITITFEPLKRFGCPSGFRISKKKLHSLFYN